MSDDVIGLCAGVQTSVCFVMSYSDVIGLCDGVQISVCLAMS